MCAGSGGSIIRSLPTDVLFTGELTHHDALAAIERGQIVITTFHSNSERGFLREVMRPRLGEVLRKKWEEGEAEVGVSGVDRDPYEVVRVLKGRERGSA